VVPRQIYSTSERGSANGFLNGVTPVGGPTGKKTAGNFATGNGSLDGRCDKVSVGCAVAPGIKTQRPGISL